MRTLIIGYGSTLRCDDGVGYLVAERLSEMLPEGAVIARQQLTPDLADAISHVEMVIFVDACAASEPGRIQVKPVAPKGENWGAFVHEMSPEVLLDCVKELYGKVPEARLITIGGGSFEIGQTLTAPVEEALEQVIQMLRTGELKQ